MVTTGWRRKRVRIGLDGLRRVTSCALRESGGVDHHTAVAGFLQPWDAGNLSLLLKMLEKGYYSDAVRYTPNSVETLYRGMAIGEEDLNWLIPGFDKVLLGLPFNRPKTINTKFVFRPRTESKISAWSSDFESAKKFAFRISENLSKQGKMGKETFAVILIAPHSENEKSFLDIQNLMRKTGFRGTIYYNASEHVGIGDVRVSKMMVMRINEDVYFGDDNRSQRNIYDRFKL
jgi:hypothetical protein